MASRAHLIGRLALALTAVAAVVWAAGSLRAVDRERYATKLLGGAQGSGPTGLNRGREAFRRARPFNDDPDLAVQEAAALLLTRRQGAAEGPARRAARAEPENVLAWLALYRATAGRDRATATDARRRALALDPAVRAVIDRGLPRAAP